MSKIKADCNENYFDWLNKNCLPVQETLQLPQTELRKIKIFLEQALKAVATEIKLISVESAMQYELENYINGQIRIVKLRLSRKRCCIYVDDLGLNKLQDYLKQFLEQVIIDCIDRADTSDFGTLNKVSLGGSLFCIAPIIKLEVCLEGVRTIAFIYFDPSLLALLSKERLNYQQRLFDELRINSKLVFRAQLKNICAFNQLIPGKIIPLDRNAQLNIKHLNQNISVMISQDHQQQFNLKREGVEDAAY